MANEDIDLKQEVKKESKVDKDLIKNIVINLSTTALVCVVFLIANFVIQTNLLNSKLAGLNNKDENAEVIDGEEVEQIKHGVVVDLGDFILNLADENQRRYLKTNVAIEITVADNDVEVASAKEEPKKEGEEAAAPTQSELEKRLGEYKPAIRDAVITNLSSKTAAELSTTAGKELAKEQILAAINGILAGQNEVLRVSFGQFIIQ